MSGPALSPHQRYQADLARPGFVADQAQAAAVEALQQVFETLEANPPKRRLMRRSLIWPPVAGLYLWGGVGRGKTHLMDAFFDALPPEHKQRTHFHRFLLDVHARRRRYPDSRDPLRMVAAEIASQVRVLCFDEFYVSDIADAMILGRLFKGLFARGVTLVATSNCEPDQLYPNGLQRANFLPAIDMLKAHVRVLNVDGGTDYRLRALTRAELYHWPNDPRADELFENAFEDIAPEPGCAHVKVEIDGRTLHARRLADGVVWFEFNEVCDGPRSAADYIELAREYHTVLISRIPQLTVEREDPARRFINLVDEFYDRGVKLLLAADVPQEQLYTGKRLQFEFRRTQSRLQEMQSQEYLAKPHLA
ncbi:cell division protein ZapE [Panacagrimonas sp.]|uniref:cell division protein ZapE n=1 Tax=Panacagrimonas sp. TaxID=2480088 RepID=UPI003B51F243